METHRNNEKGKINERVVSRVINNYCEVGSKALERFNGSEKEQIYNIASIYYGLTFNSRLKPKK